MKKVFINRHFYGDSTYLNFSDGHKKDQIVFVRSHNEYNEETGDILHITMTQTKFDEIKSIFKSLSKKYIQENLQPDSGTYSIIFNVEKETMSQNQTRRKVLDLYGSKLTDFDSQSLNYRITQEETFDSNDIYIIKPADQMLIPSDHILCNFYSVIDTLKDIIKEGNAFYIESDILENLDDLYFWEDLYDEFKQEFKKANN